MWKPARHPRTLSDSGRMEALAELPTAPLPRASVHGSRVLFVTRKYPPSVGGMETLSRNVYRCLSRATHRPRLIALGSSQKHLLWWIPLAMVHTGWLLATGRVTHVIAGDALTFGALRWVTWIRRPRTATLVCGLDLTWAVAPYQKYLRRVLPSADRVVSISEATAEEAIARGVSPDRLVVLHPGVVAAAPSEAERESARTRIVEHVGADSGAVLLLTLGRLVRRKGARWFVSSVLPGLPPEAVYVVAGAGPERAAIAKAARDAGVEHRVRMLGRVSDALREELLSGCDVFVQPNIRVPGDMEGFGLVLVESALRGTPVVAAGLEGIRDAVVHGETGYLCEPGSAAAFARTLAPLILDAAKRRSAGLRFRMAAEKRYSVARMQEEIFTALDLEES